MINTPDDNSLEKAIEKAIDNNNRFCGIISEKSIEGTIDKKLVEGILTIASEYLNTIPEVQNLDDKIGYVFIQNNGVHLFSRYVNSVSDFLQKQRYVIKEQKYNTTKNNSRTANIIFVKKQHQLKINFFHEKDNKDNYFILEILKSKYPL